MSEKLIDKSGYFAIGSIVYHVTQDDEGHLKAVGYSKTKGFITADGWNVLLEGDIISEKEYLETVKNAPAL